MIPASEAVAQALRPTQIYLEGRLPMVLEASTAKQLGLSDGQVIQAQTQSQAGKWWFQFQSGLQMELPREWAAMARLVAGETIRFKVSFQADGTILLRPSPLAAQAPGAGATAPPVSADAAASIPTLPGRIGELLARPASLSNLAELFKLGVLESLVQRAGQEPAALAQWWLSRPSLSQLNAEQLRRWIGLSGWFNESLLAQGKPLMAGDSKTALRALLQSLRQSQDGQAQTVEDALSDMEASQLSQALAPGAGESALGVMLAFSDSGPVKLKFKREQRTQDESSRAWVVDLEMNETELGAIWLRSRLTAGSQVDLTMWAERATVVQMAQTQSYRLKQLLEQAQLRVNSLQFFQGIKPADEPLRAAASSPGICVDVRT